MPAVVRPATVAEPMHTRMMAAIIQPSTSGGMAIPSRLLAISLLTPLSVNTVKNIHSEPLQTFQPKTIAPEKLPGTANSLLTSLLPVLLLVIATVIPYIFNLDEPTGKVVLFMGDPVIVMLFSLIVATWSLGIAMGMKLGTVMNHYTEAAKDVVLILLIVAGAGALKQILVDSGVSGEIGALLQDMAVNPLILGWLIAAIIRVCVGSATVAGLTAAGIIAPVLALSGTDPNLMVLSVGAGSLMFSHVNDAGFWLFKEYFNLSIRDTIRSWSLMETIIAVLGLAGVLIAEQII